MAAKIPGIGQLANLVGKEVAKGMLRLGNKTAVKVTKPAKVSKPRGPKPFKTNVEPNTPATVKGTKGTSQTINKAASVSGSLKSISPEKSAKDNKIFQKSYNEDLTDNSKVIGYRRIKDIAGTSGVAGTAAYVAGKKNKKK